jgi:hypothetical protein
VTGHSYIVYGPLANGAISLMFDGVPNYPDASRFWQVCDKHKVNIFYTAPTAIRALMREGEAPVEKCSLASLRLLGSVGEPINPEAWLWYHRVVGKHRCPIVDTWWQTETGGILISPLPGATELKPGSATRPLFGIFPEIVDANGKVLEGACEGNLCIADSWPGQMRTVYGDHKRFAETYFRAYPGKYFTGDGCRRDEDGYYWITGRVDDVINVSGHRMGTAEVESALVAHAKVAEAAVVGYPHDIKGQGIYAYVTLKAGIEPDENLRKELVQWVRKEIGPIASPDLLQWAPGLPKTRSGKIMRRILRKIAENEFSNRQPDEPGIAARSTASAPAFPQFSPIAPTLTLPRLGGGDYTRRCRTTSLPQVGGGSGWGLLSPPHDLREIYVRLHPHRRPAEHHHRHPHHGAAEEGHPAVLDEGAENAARGAGAHRRARLHAALRADARGSGDAGLMVLAAFHARSHRGDAGGLHRGDRCDGRDGSGRVRRHPGPAHGGAECRRPGHRRRAARRGGRAGDGLAGLVRGGGGAGIRRRAHLRRLAGTHRLRRLRDLSE